MTNAWETLHIQPTQDEAAIKKAYASRLRELLTNGADNTEKQALKEAFDFALQYAKAGTSSTAEIPPFPAELSGSNFEEYLRDREIHLWENEGVKPVLENTQNDAAFSDNEQAIPSVKNAEAGDTPQPFRQRLSMLIEDPERFILAAEWQALIDCLHLSDNLFSCIEEQRFVMAVLLNSSAKIPQFAIHTLFQFFALESIQEDINESPSAIQNQFVQVREKILRRKDISMENLSQIPPEKRGDFLALRYQLIECMFNPSKPSQSIYRALKDIDPNDPDIHNIFITCRLIREIDRVSSVNYLFNGLWPTIRQQFRADTESKNSVTRVLSLIFRYFETNKITSEELAFLDNAEDGYLPRGLKDALVGMIHFERKDYASALKNWHTLFDPVNKNPNGRYYSRIISSNFSELEEQLQKQKISPEVLQRLSALPFSRRKITTGRGARRFAWGLLILFFIPLFFFIKELSSSLVRTPTAPITAPLPTPNPAAFESLIDAYSDQAEEPTETRNTSTTNTSTDLAMIPRLFLSAFLTGDDATLRKDFIETYISADVQRIFEKNILTQPVVTADEAERITFEILPHELYNIAMFYLDDSELLALEWGSVSQQVWSVRGEGWSSMPQTLLDEWDTLIRTHPIRSGIYFAEKMIDGSDSLYQLFGENTHLIIAEYMTPQAIEIFEHLNKRDLPNLDSGYLRMSHTSEDEQRLAAVLYSQLKEPLIFLIFDEYGRVDQFFIRYSSNLSNEVIHTGILVNTSSESFPIDEEVIPGH